MESLPNGHGKQLELRHLGTMQAQTELEAGRTEVEKIMLGLPSDGTDKERKMYIAGHIDCLGLKGIVTEETREILYAEYCF